MKPKFYLLTLWSGLVLLCLCLLASVAIGSRVLPLATTFEAFSHYDPASSEHLLVRELRLPRTLVTFFCGSALAVAGLLMQSMTRNPIVEPGLLGISAGAMLSVVVGIAVFGAVSPPLMMLWGGLGAGLCVTLVVGLGGANQTISRDKLILAGVAFSSVCLAIGQFIIVSSDMAVFEQFRHWMVGATAGRGFDILWPLIVCWSAALVLALGIAPSLDALVLGDALSKVLGVNARALWHASLLAITLMAGAATAAAGPIVFIGLVVPYLARVVCASSHSKQLIVCAMYGGIGLLCADILGRLLAAPSEVSTGVMMALIGGPLFVWLVRRDRRVL